MACACLFLCHVILLASNSPGGHWNPLHTMNNMRHPERSSASVCPCPACVMVTPVVSLREVLSSRRFPVLPSSPWSRIPCLDSTMPRNQLPRRFPSAKSCRVSAAPKLLYLFFWKRRGLSQICSLTHVVLVKSCVQNSPHSVFLTAFLAGKLLSYHTWGLELVDLVVVLGATW